MSEKHIYDMVVIGGGPPGYTTPPYAARAGLDVVVLEKLSAGGQMALTTQIDNYPGFDEGVDGFELAEKMQRQAERFGSKSEFADVTDMDLTKDVRVIRTEDGEYDARTVVIATGADPRELGLPGRKCSSEKDLPTAHPATGCSIKARMLRLSAEAIRPLLTLFS